jgi:hypothetical protein
MRLGNHARRSVRAHDFLDRLGQGAKIVGPPFRIDDQADGQHRLELFGQARHDLARATHVAPDALAGDHLVENRPDRIDVAAGVVELTRLRLGWQAGAVTRI